MNAKQKQELKRIFGELETLQEAAGNLASALQDDWDEKSDKWKESEKGQEAESEATAVQSLADAIEHAKDEVSDRVGDD